MAQTRRGYIFSAFLLSVLSLLLTIVSISSDSWIVSSARVEGQAQDSNIRYGLFRGVFDDRAFATTVTSTMYMTCLPSRGACAMSCKTNREAREQEVAALADGFRPTPTCTSVTTVDTSNPCKYSQLQRPEPPSSSDLKAALLDLFQSNITNEYHWFEFLSILYAKLIPLFKPIPKQVQTDIQTPPVISFIFYVFVVLTLCLQLTFAAISALLTVINATKNPTEPMFGLPGCRLANIVASILGVIVLLMFGIYWATSGLQGHLAFSFIALDFYEPDAGLGYSYWLLIVSVASSIASVALIQLRSYLLERDPPPPTLKVENHSDGTIFLY